MGYAANSAAIPSPEPKSDTPNERALCAAILSGSEGSHERFESFLALLGMIEKKRFPSLLFRA
jgi:hypothetical protein